MFHVIAEQTRLVVVIVVVVVVIIIIIIIIITIIITIIIVILPFLSVKFPSFNGVSKENV
jgi:hypothetical protein